jgi:hypothetical protein
MTTTIARPKRRRASDAGRSRLGDLRRRRLPTAARIASHKHAAWLFGLAAVAIAGAIGAALFGLPVRTWFEQDRQLRDLEHELSELQSVNEDLRIEVGRLQTDEGMVEAAREELGHIQPGDDRETMHPLPPLPRDLPDGWPYSQVDQILSIRAAQDALPEEPALTHDGGQWVDRPATSSTAVTTTTPTTIPPTAAPTTLPALVNGSPPTTWAPLTLPPTVPPVTTAAP